MIITIIILLIATIIGSVNYEGVGGFFVGLLITLVIHVILWGITATSMSIEKGNITILKRDTIELVPIENDSIYLIVSGEKDVINYYVSYIDNNNIKVTKTYSPTEISLRNDTTFYITNFTYERKCKYETFWGRNLLFFRFISEHTGLTEISVSENSIRKQYKVIYSKKE
jgi:hypothetical protein